MAGEPLEIGVVPDRYDRSWFQAAVQNIETWARTVFRGQTYTVTNATESRTLDASAATLDETRQVLATLIDDLKNGRMPQ